MKEINNKKYITQKEAMKRYGYSASWFQTQRKNKLKPVFLQAKKRGKIYYPLDETDRWFESLRSQKE
jgi:hypothetical protein